MTADHGPGQEPASPYAPGPTYVDAGLTGSPLEDREATRRRDRRRARLAMAGIGFIALIGGVLAVSVSDGSSEGEGAEGADSADREMIDAMPLGPTDGRESWRLPVAVAPQTGLQEGDTVTIYGRGFQPHDSLGVVHCTSEADTANSGVGACELGADRGFAPVQYVSADENGDVIAEVTVRRFINTPDQGNVDCASAAERCLLGMGATTDYDRSGGAYIDFAGAPGFPQPTFTVDGGGQGLHPGQAVAVGVTGWVPSRQVRIEQCALGEGGFDGTETCQPLLDGRADPAGAFTGTVVVGSEVSLDGRVVPCHDSCVLRANGIGIPEATTAPFPPAVPLGFTTEDLGPTTTPSTTAPSTPTIPDGTEAPGPAPSTSTTVPDGSSPAPPNQTDPPEPTVPGAGDEAPDDTTTAPSTVVIETPGG